MVAKNTRILMKPIIKESFMAPATSIKIGDNVYFLKRPDQDHNTIDNKGAWLAGAGKVIGVITKNGERKLTSTPVSNVSAVRILPYTEEGEADVIEAKIGEFTYKLADYLKNLLA
jgi:hypothetical protein